MSGDNKNLLLAIALSLVILLGFQAGYNYFFPKPQQPPRPAGQAEVTQPAAPTPGQPVQVPSPGGATGAPGTVLPGATPGSAPRNELLAKSPRVKINTPRIHGSIALLGGRIDDVSLPSYRETIDPNSPEIVLFSPPGAADPYFVETGWVPVGPGIAVPGPETLWTADRTELTPRLR